MPLPVVSIAQMREWESAAWKSGQTEIEVIQRVGVKLAARACLLTGPRERILILAGPGNNGADARAAVPHLGDRDAQLICVSDPTGQLSEITLALALKPALIIDALFGIGLNRPLSADWVRLIEAVNQSGSKVLAVDVPSGLNADSGKPEGAAIRATETLTVGAPKTGMLTADGPSLVGRLIVANDVGLGECPLRTETNWVLPHDFAGFPPPRSIDSHKGKHGHLAIFAGSEGYHGAATLCARGAQRARPGLITLFTMDSVYPMVATQLQAVMVARWHPHAHLAESWSAIVVGPGLANPEIPDEFGHMIRRLWRDSNLPVVVDASALAWLKAGPVNSGFLRVITPHPGEAARMLGVSTEAVQADRPRAVRNLSQKFGGTWVVLKGHQTLIGQSRGEIHVNCSGSPSLGQGGTGDLLAGYIGGLIAQSALRTSPSRAIAYGVWQHGASADLLDSTRPNWIVEELAEALGSAGLRPA